MSLAFAALLLAWVQLPPPVPAQAIVDVTVVDVAAGALRPRQTVLIAGETIAAVGPADAVELPEGCARIDGRGLYLMPGLIDAHVHYVDPATFGPLCLANGVVAARDMGQPTASALYRREQLRSGAQLGPELYVSGAIVDGDPPSWPFSEPCATPEAGRAAVGRLAEAGVDFIKVYSKLDRATWQAVAAEAQARGLRIAGHVPEDVNLEEALAVMASGEHLMGFERWIGRLLGAEITGSAERPWANILQYTRLGEVPPEILQSALQALAAHDCVQVPTLVVMEGLGAIGDEDAAAELAYVSPALRAFWQQEEYRDFAPVARRVLPHMQALVGALHAAGVPLACGTDLANPNVVAGFSLHRELELLAAAGLPPAAALRAATVNSARLCGREDRLGAIAPGMTASLLLLRADPLADVRHTRAIEAVLLRGRRFDRAALDGLLEEARRWAGG